VKPLTHEHDVGDARAHVNGEKMLVQDTRDDTMQQEGFDCNPPHGIALLESSAGTGLSTQGTLTRASRGVVGI